MPDSPEAGRPFDRSRESWRLAACELMGQTIYDQLQRADLDAIWRAADRAAQLSFLELRQMIDEVSAFLAERVLADTEDEELNRLAEKLDALRERLVYSYFGTAELWLLQSTLDELHARIALGLPTQDAIPA